MYDRKQQNYALAGLITTVVGLLTLFLVPVAVGMRLKGDFDQITRLEQTRQSINETVEVALQSDTFLMHRFTVPGATSGQYVAASEYARLQRAWKRATAYSGVREPLRSVDRANYDAGVAAISRWIDAYLSGYVGSGDPGGPGKLEDEETRYNAGLRSLMAARDAAILQEQDLRASQLWLNRAEVTIVAPLAILCFGLAFLAWINLRTLQRTWMREREISGHLEIAVKESNHRIKNNLQVIGALIDMQIQEPGATVPKSSLEAIVHQVRAVAAVHDFFSYELKSDQIQGDEMLRHLVDLTASPIGLKVELELEGIALAVKQATAVALITNELLINSCKHGATQVRVKMTATGLNACLRVSDNGPGFPSGFNASTSANLGLSLVDTLARHDLHGSVHFENEPGACVDVTFPLVGAAKQASASANPRYAL